MKKHVSFALALVLPAFGLSPVALAPAHASGTTCGTLEYVASEGDSRYSISAVTSTGSCDWEVPVGVDEIEVLLVGAGGGGAGGSRNGRGGAGGGGGGAGELVTVSFSVAPGDVLTLSVGTGGASGLPDSNGGLGSSSSLTLPDSSVVEAQGGMGGLVGSTIGGHGGDVGGGAFSGAAPISGLQGGSGGTNLNSGQIETGANPGSSVMGYSSSALVLAAGGGGGNKTQYGLRILVPGSGGYGGRGPLYPEDNPSSFYSYAYNGAPGMPGAIYLRYVTGPTWTNGQVDRANTTTGTPIKVGTDGESVVTINGSNFSTVTSVTVGGLQASFSATSNTTLVFNAPANSVATYDLEISSPAGTLTKSNYVQYLARPTLITDAVLNGSAVASQSVTISGSTWQNWNVKQYAWFRCLTQITAAQDGVPSDCSAIGWGGSSYELRSADICKFVTLREDVNNGGVYVPYRTIVSTERVLASSSPWVLVANAQNNSAETCSTMSATVPAATSKSGLVFVEWNTDSNGNGTAYMPGDPLSLTGNLQLFAIYETPSTPGSDAESGPTPTQYMGPMPTHYSDREPSVGDQVRISGKRLALVESVSIDGLNLTILNQSEDSLTILIPESAGAGQKDLVMTGGFGRLTVVSALSIAGSSDEDSSNSEVGATKVNVGSLDGRIAVYAKGHKGKTLSWKIAGKWHKTVIESDYQVFQRKTLDSGREVKVDLYIDGEKTLSTSVTTK